MSLVDVVAAVNGAPPAGFFARRAYPVRRVGDTFVGFDSRLIASADARIGYAAQPSAPNIQAYGSTSTNLSAGADVAGASVDGSTSRFARVADPDDAEAWCWRWRVHPDDPDTASSKRGEFSFSSNQPPGATFDDRNTRVVGFCLRLQDWTALTDEQIVFQAHGPDGAPVGNPWLSLQVVAGAMRLQLRYDTAVTPDPGTVTVANLWEESDWTPETWERWVLRLRSDYAGLGIVQVMRDGIQIVEYAGPVGYNDSAVGASYLKNGYYHWVNSGNDWDTDVNTREVWNKGAYLATDAVSMSEMDDFLASL